MVKKKTATRIKEAYEKVVEKIKEPQVQVHEQVPLPKINFTTTDADLVTKLQNKFDIKNISYDRVNNVRTFEFYADEETIKNYFKEVI